MLRFSVHPALYRRPLRRLASANWPTPSTAPVVTIFTPPYRMKLRQPCLCISPSSSWTVLQNWYKLWIRKLTSACAVQAQGPLQEIQAISSREPPRPPVAEQDLDTAMAFHGPARWKLELSRPHGNYGFSDRSALMRPCADRRTTGR